MEKYVNKENRDRMMKEICAIAQLHFNNYEVDDMEEYVCQTARDI